VFDLQVLIEHLKTGPDQAQYLMVGRGRAKAMPINNKFWVDHGEQLEQRFNAWVAKTS
jgi:hypothetical protein